jgi:hypothetical protein
MPVDTSADLIITGEVNTPQIKSKIYTDQRYHSNKCSHQQNSRQASAHDESSHSKSTSSSGISNSCDSFSEDEVDLSEKTSYSPKKLGQMPFISPGKYRTTTTDDDPINSKASNETRTEKLIGFIQRKAPGRIIRRILKCTIAYFISTLFSTIDPLAKALGQAPYIVCSGCLLSHPGRTVGAQLDATLTSVLGAGLAIVYGLAGIAAATTYNAQHPNSYAGNGINCLFLVVGVFAAQLVRQKFPKLHFFSLQFMVVLLFSMTAGVGYKIVPLRLSSEFGLPFLIGAVVSLFVNVIFWPETAVEGLGTA